MEKIVFLDIDVVLNDKYHNDYKKINLNNLNLVEYKHRTMNEYEKATNTLVKTLKLVLVQKEKGN